MELKLKNKALDYLGAVYRNSFTHEVTMESIIPDSLPDVQRIVDADAMVYLKSMAADDGRVTISGAVDAAVIYADEEGRLRRTLVNIPFNASVDSSSITRNSKPVAAVKTASVDARLLNPRKLLIRGDVLIDIACYEQKNVQILMPDPESENTLSAELLIEEKESRLLTDISEKTFTVQDEFLIPQSKPPVGEILRSNVIIDITESKGVGNKAILRGTVRTELMYRPEKGGEPVTMEFSTLFSQIMELGVQTEGMEFKVSVVPTGLLFNTEMLFDPDGGKLTMELSAIAQSMAYKQEMLSYIADAYSNAYTLETEYQKVEIESAGNTTEILEPVRELIETTRQPGNIINITAFPGLVYKSQNDTSLKTTVTVKVLYMSDDGVLLSAAKKLSVSTKATSAQDVNCKFCAELRDQPFAVISANGIEVKLNVVFSLEENNTGSIDLISAISADDDSQKDTLELPSVVLKRFAAGDTLWSLAKKYSSVREMICRANDLEQGVEPAVGTMLIIPKNR